MSLLAAPAVVLRQVQPASPALRQQRGMQALPLWRRSSSPCWREAQAAAFSQQQW
jgi:hypothetical protein